ncbi:bcl-2-like protein 1 isoform X1 [Mustela erminea]|uniref:bcl-2-like protein 1 isoform X1 n=1 Tax=Mustela erminea TaxID=36723 RepID=UPI001387266D|nr:bcl-2-like protein 1 isoform X1 [Mustela erminea]XP_032206948.1 bcl-2-like protein 1 isoform X1 [Mustela erminea]XP_032206950.1 bcl-2-like protein 1 isoform X1 [Mustela erminea]XP_032206951.1 bcl-2-like protein 1 isoform X1 [Mustela erminea]XP_032206952.1 bcl-2-like protein 1 isoform X1 [Mustela erminea]XP_032206953.1 bcl-2-like protein 1 isoform X1 [Mustela erminea]
MSQSNRELVVDFLSYKLSQKGYSWSQFSDAEENRTEAPEGTESEMETPSAINGNPSWHLADSPAVNGATGHSSSLDAREVIPMAAVKQALREAGDEFELRYRRAFSDLTSQLHITPGTAYQSFEQVVNELFRDGVNWGRIVAFFSFGGALCVESVDKEMQALVSRIATWMATYLNDHLEPWIQENGGWVRTGLFYPEFLAHGLRLGKGSASICSVNRGRVIIRCRLGDKNVSVPKEANSFIAGGIDLKHSRQTVPCLWYSFQK